ncbi:hypothetical protein JCM10207_003405 [Rhodosporidiobolus poonsookiae]
MLAFSLVAPLLAASSVSALALERRAAPDRPGAVGFQFPPLRGFIQDETSTAPCGGLAIGGRIDYPISGGDIALVLQRDAFNIQLSYSSSENPTSASEFSPLLPVLEQSYSGSKCFQAPDLSTLGFSVGDVLTMNVNYLTGPKNSSLYQCADVTLVATDSYVASTEYTCANVTASTQTRSQGKSSSAAPSASAAAANSSSDDQPVSPIGAGFIGAAVAIVVMLVAGGLLAFAGFAKFGSRSKLAALPRTNENAPAYPHEAGSMTSRGSMVKA